MIYEGTREIHKLMQADYLLGYRVDRPTRCELPPLQRALTTSSARIRPWIPISRSNSCASSNRPRSPAPTRWARATPQVGPGGRRGDAPRDGHACRSTARSSSAKASATKRRCSTSARRSAWRTRRAAGRAGAFPQVDIAVDPLEGTNLCATGAPNAIAVLAASEQGRPAARARSLHGEAGRRPELEGRRQPRRAGRTRTCKAIAAVARPRRRGSRRRSCSIGRGTRS